MSIANQSPGKSTFDVTTGSGPYRPGAADYNGLAKEDDASPEDAPDCQFDPNAAEANMEGGLVIACCRVVPQLTVSVLWTGGTSYVVDLFCSTSSNIAASDIGIAYNGVGDLYIYVPASKLANGPGGQAFRPKVYSNHALVHEVQGFDYNDTVSTVVVRGAHVLLYTAAGAAHEGSFTVDIG